MDGSDDNDDLKRKKREAMDGKMENKAVGEEETAFAEFSDNALTIIANWSLSIFMIKEIPQMSILSMRVSCK